MNRIQLIKDTLEKIERLPDFEIEEINDFAGYLLSRLDDKILVDGIQQLSSDSKTFDYLNNEENLYSVNDIKEKYK